LSIATGDDPKRRWLEVDKALRELADPERECSQVVRLLNRFFDRDEEKGVVLDLWVTHRYDGSYYALCRGSRHVASSELEILAAKLRSDLAEAFRSSIRSRHPLQVGGMRQNSDSE